MSVFDVGNPPAPLPGDFTDDGVVDNADLNLLLRFWGDEPGLLDWPGVLFGNVDNEELNELLVGWGQTNQPVPEPTAVLVLLVGVALARRH